MALLLQVLLQSQCSVQSLLGLWPPLQLVVGRADDCSAAAAAVNVSLAAHAARRMLKGTGLAPRVPGVPSMATFEQIGRVGG